MKTFSKTVALLAVVVLLAMPIYAGGCTTKTTNTTTTTTATTTASEQIPLEGSKIAQFVDPLPSLHAIVDNGSRINLSMTEFQSPVMPTGFKPASGKYTGTWTWGYRDGNETAAETSYLGPVIVAQRGNPTEVKYINNLGTTANTKVLAYKNSTDQTLHWANPLGLGMNDPAEKTHYDGAIPAVAHLHGGEVPAVVDGGPEQWFTSDGIHGPAYYSKDNNTGGNYAIYRYPNEQESALLWFHDHTLGATRLNVYAGLAGAYLLTDPETDPKNLPEMVPMVIQDRMFDVNGQLYFPNEGINPEHPFWTPEFIGDTNVVNGKVWPYLEVKAQRYRFLIINGSNARVYNMKFSVQGSGAAPTFWQIGTDGGYLDQPVEIDELLMMPGERADIIVDFSGLATGARLLLTNDGNAPFPDGDPVDPETTGRVMQFRVISGAPATDTSFDPAATGVALRGGSGQAPAIMRFVDVATGSLAAGVTVKMTRALTLNEVMLEPSEEDGKEWEGGPAEVLVNNTDYNGMRVEGSGIEAPIPNFADDGIGNYISELPYEGSVEVWEIINTTADAHPIHLHLVQFQLLNRQQYDEEEYISEYNELFPGGDYIPGYGPPLDYGPSTLSGGKHGGNPDVTPYLIGTAQPPAANEAGWKDTIMAPPGTITRIVVRWAPTTLALNTAPAALIYPFEPNFGPYNYVWHCHIIDHEDNEMMRPDRVIPMVGATRTYVRGVDY